MQGSTYLTIVKIIYREKLNIYKMYQRSWMHVEMNRHNKT